MFSTSWNRAAVRFEEIEKFLMKSRRLALWRQKSEKTFVNKSFWRKQYIFFLHRKEFLGKNIKLGAYLFYSCPSLKLGLSHVLPDLQQDQLSCLSVSLSVCQYVYLSCFFCHKISHFFLSVSLSHLLSFFSRCSRSAVIFSKTAVLEIGTKYLCYLRTHATTICV